LSEDSNPYISSQATKTLMSQRPKKEIFEELNKKLNSIIIDGEIDEFMLI